MAFMLPQITHESMWQIETTCGTELVPADVVGTNATAESLADYLEGDPRDNEPELVTGFFARLSAPGYMDCTPWAGPFESEQEAREHIESAYDVDSDTGEDLPEPEPIHVYQLTAEDIAAQDQDLVYEYSKRHEFRLCYMNSRTRDAMLDAMVNEQGIRGGWFYRIGDNGFENGPYDTAREARDAAEKEQADS